VSTDFERAACESGETARRERATCAAPSCWRDAANVSLGGREALLCEIHRKAFLGVSS